MRYCPLAAPSPTRWVNVFCGFFFCGTGLARPSDFAGGVVMEGGVLAALGFKRLWQSKAEFLVGALRDSSLADATRLRHVRIIVVLCTWLSDLFLGSPGCDSKPDAQVKSSESQKLQKS
jgi:hypothetical protein